MVPTVFVPKPAMVRQEAIRVVKASKELSRDETVPTAHSQNPLQTALDQASTQGT